MINQAIVTGKIDTLEAIFKKGQVNVNDPLNSATYITALHLACAKDDLKAVQILLGLGADPNAVEATNKTPLHVAAGEAREDADVCKALIEAGADINAQTTGGETPLMKAIYFGRKASVEFLLAQGANVTLQNTEG